MHPITVFAFYYYNIYYVQFKGTNNAVFTHTLLKINYVQQITKITREVNIPEPLFRDIHNKHDITF